MRGKDNNSLGLDIHGNVFSYTLQFCTGGMVLIIHNVRLPLWVNAHVNHSSKDGYPSWTRLTPPWERLLEEISANDMVEISWEHRDRERTYKNTGVLTIITPAAEKSTALLSPGEMSRGLPNKSIREKATSSQYKMLKTVRKPEVKRGAWLLA